MRGSYSASVSLTNENLQWTPEDYLWKPFQVKLDSQVLVSSGIPAGCFEGNVRWIYGLVTNFDEMEDIPKKEIVLSVNSFASRLGKKPVNTGELSNVQEALEEIAINIGGLSSQLAVFAPTDKIIRGVVSGDNMMEEMRKVAQAGGQDIFVNRSGVLVTQDWKDHNSPVDVVVPPQAVKDAKRRRDIEAGPTRYQVRGSWEWLVKIVGAREQSSRNSGSDANNPANGRGKMGYCIANGIPKPFIDLPMRDIPAARKEAIEIELMGDGEYAGPADLASEVGHGSDGKTSIRMTRGPIADPAAFYPKGEFEAKLSAKARDPGTASLDAPVMRDRVRASMGKEDKDRVKAIMRALGTGGGRVPSGRHSGGAGGAGGGGSPDKTPDEKDETQLEVIVEDPDLQAEFGVITDELNNPYIPTRDMAFNVAVRSFQEFKMARKTWDFEVTYMTCLDIGQKITITTPKGREITGLLTAIRLSYSADPQASMTLTVESMEDLGSTVYTSRSNLLVDPLPSSDAPESWVFSNGAYGRPEQALFLPMNAFAEQSIALTIGDEYTWRAVHTGSSVTLEVRDTTGLYVFNTTPIVFTPDEVQNWVKINNAGTEVEVYSLVLTKEKLA
jgi:hypothetical protein